MKKGLVIVAPKGPGRDELIRYFSPKAPVFSLERERVIQEGQLAIFEESLLFKGKDLLENASAAIILDSGYMWPVPSLEPSAAEWKAFHGRFDDFLRNERETASLWYSVMEIFSERLERPINPQSAFAYAAMKPFAFEILAEQGALPLPYIATNNMQALSDFAKAHDGFFQTLPFDTSASTVDVERSFLQAFALDKEPLIVQAKAAQECWHLMVVGETVVDAKHYPNPAELAKNSKNTSDKAPQPSAAIEHLPQAIKDQILPIQRALTLEWSTLQFSRGADGWRLANFSPAPDLATLSVQAQEGALDALWQLIQPHLEGKR